MTYPVLPDFVGVREAMRLANSRWEVSSEGKVFGLLIGDRLRGWLVEEDGEAHALPASFWRGKDFRHVLSTGEVSQGPLRRGELQFKRDDLSDALAEDSTSHHTADGTKTSSSYVPAGQISIADQQEDAVRRGKGRSSNSQIDEFWIEACRMVDKSEQAAIDGQGHTQRAFIDAMTAWSQKNMTAPYSPDTVEKKIKALWRVLRTGSN